jgi:hypothetical protein
MPIDSVSRSGVLGFALAVLLAGCAGGGGVVGASSGGSQHAFMARLNSLCGRAFSGRLVTSGAADAGMAGQPLIMHVRRCSPERVEIPFHVGADRSRTWIITRTARGLRLKHDHRHEDGTSDKVTMYGGDTADSGSATRQSFPVDAESIATFRREGLDRSVTNVWTVEVTADRFSYELRRPPGPNARHFRVEFDLIRAVPAPPAAWGWASDR